MSILKFLIKPEENYKNNRIYTTFLTFILYFILSIGGVVLLSLLDHLANENTPTFTGRELPLLCVILVGPLVEELIFRLPLRRNKYTVFFFFATVLFVLFSKMLSGTIYSWHLFFVRIALSLFGSFVMYSWGLKFICQLKFEYLFYFFAFAFGAIHAFNYALNITSISMLLFLMLYVGNKFITGLVLGYARLAHGFIVVVILHMLNNFLPILFLDFLHIS